MKIFLFNFNGFTINERVLGSVPAGEQRNGGLKLFGLVWCLREGNSVKDDITEVLIKLMVNKCLLNQERKFKLIASGFIFKYNCCMPLQILLKNSFLEDNKTLSICFIVCIKLFKVKPCKCKAPNIFKQRKKNFNGSEKKEYNKFTKFIK